MDQVFFGATVAQAMVFAIEDSPVYMLGAFDLMAALLDDQAKVQPAFRTGGGVAWGDQAGCLFCATACFFRPGYHNYLVSQWLPALDGVVDKLEHGAEVADVGCGHGWSTVLMAQAFPHSRCRQLSPAVGRFTSPGALRCRHGSAMASRQSD